MAGVKRWAGGDKAMLGDSDGFGKIHHQINKFQKIENPGLDPEKPSFTGKMKAHFNPHTGYTSAGSAGSQPRTLKTDRQGFQSWISKLARCEAPY